MPSELLVWFFVGVFNYSQIFSLLYNVRTGAGSCQLRLAREDRPNVGSMLACWSCQGVGVGVSVVCFLPCQDGADSVWPDAGRLLYSLF